MVRVRFAPSPTGYLHVGGARTALFNWLFARHHGGVFVLRMEDTDRERSTDASIEEILESLRWLGLDWDEYYRQTERCAAHRRAAEALIEKGCAYEHEGAWWFRVPTEGQTIVRDELLGDVAYPNDQLKDFVIRRSDGSFVYNFVVVVDDADMEITHVIRGDDHLNNAPKQILLYRALGRSVPRFVHVPQVLGPDRSRLSKRHGATSVLEYRARGFLPETLLNFFARLGWAHGDREVFSRDELVELFTIAGINKSAAMFEDTKLLWLNQQHLKRTDLDLLVDLVEPFVLARGAVAQEMWTGCDRERLRTGVGLLRDRSHTLEDLGWAMELLFPVPLVSQDEMKITDGQAELVLAIAEALSGLDPFGPDRIEAAIRATLTERDAKLKDVALPCRIAVTGRKAGPGLFDILSSIGAAIVVDRLRTFAERRVR
jgi:glutamyl-tRNA synthetase